MTCAGGTMPFVSENNLDAHRASLMMKGAISALHQDGPFGELARDFAREFPEYWLNARRISGARSVACYLRALAEVANPWIDEGFWCAPRTEEDISWATAAHDWLFPRAKALGIFDGELDYSGLPID